MRKIIVYDDISIITETISLISNHTIQVPLYGYIEDSIYISHPDIEYIVENDTLFIYSIIDIDINITYTTDKIYGKISHTYDRNANTLSSILNVSTTLYIDGIICMSTQDDIDDIEYKEYGMYILDNNIISIPIDIQYSISYILDIDTLTTYHIISLGIAYVGSIHILPTGDTIDIHREKVFNIGVEDSVSIAKIDTNAISFTLYRDIDIPMIAIYASNIEPQSISIYNEYNESIDNTYELFQDEVRIYMQVYAIGTYIIHINE